MSREMKNSGIEWIGQIPQDWDIRNIKHMADTAVINSYIDGDWIESPYVTDEGIRYLTSGNIGDGFYKEQGNSYISEESFAKLNCKFAYPGDLVFSRLNEPYGRSCILPDTEDCYVLAVDDVILRPFSYIDKKYVCYLTMCDGYHRAVGEEARGTAMKRISRTNLGLIKLSLPSLSEQHAIVHFLDRKCSAIDTAIEKTKKSIEKLEEYKKAVITKAVTKGIDPNAKMKDSGVEWIGEIPEGWNVCKIDSLYYPRSTKVSDKDYLPLSVTMKGIVPQLSSTAKTDDHDNRKLVKKGDFAINSRSDRRGSCGISEYDGSVSLINTVLQPRHGMNNEYYNWLFHSDMFSSEFYRLGHGIVDDLRTTSWQEMKKMVIPAPSPTEQQQIVHFLDRKCTAIDTAIEKKKKAIEKWEEYKKSLIYYAVTGKIDCRGESI